MNATTHFTVSTEAWPLQIAVSSICWVHDSLENAVRKARDCGFTALEPLVFPAELCRVHGDLRELRATDLRALLAKHGVKLAALHLGAIRTSSEAQRKSLTDYAKRAIEVAVELGCRVIVEGGPDRASEPLAPFLRSLEELAAAIEGTDVKIALENHYRNWIQDIQDYEYIFQHVDHPQMGITLDTGHFTSAGVHSAGVVRRFGGKILHVHVKDHIGTQSVPLGMGRTDNLAVARELKTIGFTGYLSQELEVAEGIDADQAARDGYGYMTRLCQV
jgi:sugar phosphate isomerase/epimerase